MQGLEPQAIPVEPQPMQLGGASRKTGSGGVDSPQLAV